MDHDNCCRDEDACSNREKWKMVLGKAGRNNPSRVLEMDEEEKNRKTSNADGEWTP